MTASISKLLWLAEHEPELVARTARLLDVHAFLVHRLTGQYRTGLANATHWACSIWSAALADDLYRAIGLRPDQFVELVEPGAVIGFVTPVAAAATGLPACPSSQGPATATVPDWAPMSREGIAYLNLGTGIASGARSPTYLCDRAFRTLIAPVPGSYYVEHILRGGVYTVAWFVERFAADLRGGEQGGPPRPSLRRRPRRLPPAPRG